MHRRVSKGRDRARALALANEARDADVGVDGRQDELAAVEQWLGEHGRDGE